MRKFSIISAVLFAVATFAAACAAPTAPSSSSANSANMSANANMAGNAGAAAAEAEIRKLMSDGAAALAKNDADAMDKIYGPSYMLVNNDGSVQNREARLAALRSGDVKYSAFAYDEANIRVNPDATGAVVIAKATLKATVMGKPLEGQFRVTQVYSKTKDGWKQVSAQATPIIAAGPAAGLPTPEPMGKGLPTPAEAMPSNSNK